MEIMEITLTKLEIQMIAEMLSQAAVKVSQARVAADLNDRISAALAEFAANEKG